MIARILWSFILIVTIYVSAVFIAPDQADQIGGSLWIMPFNSVLREFKNASSDEVDVPGIKDINQGSWALQMARDVATDAVEKIQDTTDQIQQAAQWTQQAVETKVQQTHKVVNSVKKTAGAIEELKGNISELTTLTGSSGSGSTLILSGTRSASGASVASRK